MSYQFPQQQQAPRRKPGGGMFLMILLGVGAFLIFSRMGAGGGGAGQNPQAPRGAAEPAEYDYTQREDLFEAEKPKSKIGQAMPSTGGTGAAAGWGMDDVKTQEKPKSDWSMDVDH